MEETTLRSHMNSKKHVERSPSDQCIKSMMSPAPAPPLIMLKIIIIPNSNLPS